MEGMFCGKIETGIEAPLLEVYHVALPALVDGRWWS